MVVPVIVDLLWWTNGRSHLPLEPLILTWVSIIAHIWIVDVENFGVMTGEG
jgi:hypothetical protein